jgi:hypothetical protein
MYFFKVFFSIPFFYVRYAISMWFYNFSKTVSIFLVLRSVIRFFICMQALINCVVNHLIMVINRNEVHVIFNFIINLLRL